MNLKKSYHRKDILPQKLLKICVKDTRIKICLLLQGDLFCILLFVAPTFSDNLDILAAILAALQIPDLKKYL